MMYRKTKYKYLNPLLFLLIFSICSVVFVQPIFSQTTTKQEAKALVKDSLISLTDISIRAAEDRVETQNILSTIISDEEIARWSVRNDSMLKNIKTSTINTDSLIARSQGIRELKNLQTHIIQKKQRVEKNVKS